MTTTGIFARIFEPSTTEANAMIFLDPAQLETEANSPEVAGWQLLLGSIALRRAGQRSPANDWLNHASHLGVDDDIFKAELLGEAGQALYSTDRPQDAFNILNSANAIWRDVCQQAADACTAPKSKAASDFASRLLLLFEAANTKPPVTKTAIRGGTGAVLLIRQWLEERAVIGRAETAAAFVRVLCQGQQIENGTSICAEEMEWTVQNFTSPAVPVAARAIEERQMASTVRRALYTLQLAKGEVDMAAGEFEKSAAEFRQAAAIYDGQVTDNTDTSRLLRAKFNEANSLLRLSRFDEAISIYELCEHGFNSINDDAAAQRVAHAKLLAQTKAADSDEP